MKTTDGAPRPRLILMACLMVLLASPLSLAAQENSSPSATPQTTADPTVPVEHLKVMLRPLTRDELQVEQQAWLDLLRAKIQAVGAEELKLKVLEEKVAESEQPSEAPSTEAVDQRTEQFVALRAEEAALVERASTVAEALKLKGGDVSEAESYLAAVSDLGETTDATAFWAAAISQFTVWLKQDDGGRYWARRTVFALIVFLFFWIASKFAGKAAARALSRHASASDLLTNFARRTAGGVVVLVGIAIAISALGVEVGPLMAAMGAGGFIVGFAMQETLASFASGLMIMIYQPFDVDDYVAVGGFEGTVKEMSLVSTKLLTLDNKVLVIPNKKAWSDTIVNYTGKDIRRVDLVFGIGYDDDIQQATDVLKEIAEEHKLILDEPAVTVHVDALADSSVNLFCRPWVKTIDYWTVHWDLTRQVKERFDAEGISIPYPQRDVHTHTVTAPV